MTRRLRVFAALACSIPALAGAGDPSRVHPVNDFVLNAVPGLSRMTVAEAKKLGTVLRIQDKRARSDWYDGEVTYRTLVFDGAELNFAVHEGRKDFLVSAVFTKASWKLRGGLAVGVGKDAVLRAFGQGQDDGMILRYEGDPDGAPQFAEFTIENGVVTRVKVTPYTG